ncbi:MAG: SDR family NAD(P)-dependent oxidoreductase, partial [Oscillospiraceae bacterium]|nr:SDR family NAD(P)-dependent oxidoreductase [Oscillospiraceae bacterium]
MEFANKTAISTGAASGMGLLFAQQWASRGGNVVMCDVNLPVLEEEAAKISAAGRGKAVAVSCDVRDYHQVCAARDRAVDIFGSIDVMANFAGGYSPRMLKVDRKEYPEFPDVPIEVFDWGLDVNLKGPFYFAHSVMKQMREQKSGL